MFHSWPSLPPTRAHLGVCVGRRGEELLQLAACSHLGHGQLCWDTPFQLHLLHLQIAECPGKEGVLVICSKFQLSSC